MKRGEKLVAMIAPAAEKQFPGKIEQLLSACAKAGFGDVMEVALGAEKTTEHETAEFIERMEKDPKMFMTTSCCPAWVNLVGKHLPNLVDHVSLTPSPMVYAREIVKAKDPNAKTVSWARSSPDARSTSSPASRGRWSVPPTRRRATTRRAAA